MASPWCDILAAGVDDWSEYSDTDSDRDAFDVDDAGAPSALHVDGLRRKQTTDDGFRALRASGGSARESGSGHESAGGAKDGAGGENGDGAHGDGDSDDRGVGRRTSASGTHARGGKIGLDGAWRSARRGLEWQCAWIELRMREIGRHVERYAARLEAMDASTAVKKTKNAGAVANVPSRIDNLDEVDIKKMQLRAMSARGKRARETKRAKAPPVVLGHPMFAPLVQLDDKEKSANARDDEDDATHANGSAKIDPSVTTTHDAMNLSASKKRDASVDDANPKTLASKKTKVVMNSIAPKETNSDSDLSTTALYEQIEAANRRLASLKELISKPAPKLAAAQPTKDKAKTPAQKNKHDKHVEKTPASAGSGRKSNNRNVDSYDINNVVSANASAKYVERPIHETIATPRVRASQTFEMTRAQVATDGDSSEEDVSDAVFIFRHAKLEVAEKKARAPLQKARRGEKLPSKPSGKGSLLSRMNGENPFTAEAPKAEPIDESTRVNTPSIEG